jgi:Ca-activated chloride channel homolog
MTTAIRGVWPCPEAPFRGLDPYRFRDRPIFFERETETRSLLQLITIYRASLLYGESGSGKSSLINAGLIPELLENGFTPERIRVQPIVDSEFVVERIEGSSSSEFIPSALLKDTKRTTISTSSLLSTIKSLKSKQTPVLIFDQFEEFHTLAGELNEDQQRGAREAQQNITKVLLSLIQEPGISVRSLLVFREDYLAKFDELFYLCPELPDRFLRLTPPTSEAIPEILRGPFTTDRLLQPCWTREISSELAERLEQHLRPTDGRVVISLAQVQVVALQLWRSNDPSHTLQTRGVEGVVKEHLEGALAPFGRDRKVAEALLTFLITKQGTRKVLLETDALEQAKREEGVRPEVASAVLNRLVLETRLVRRDFNRNAPSYEIVSEFLVPWIRTLKIQRSARQARNRWLRWAVAIFAILVSVLGLIFYWKYRTTTVEAQSRRLVAQYREESDTSHKELDATKAKLNDALRVMSASADQQVKELSQQLIDLRAQSDAKEADRDKLSQQLQETQTALIDSRSRLDKAESDLKTATSEIAGVRHENQELRDTIEKLQKSVDETKKTPNTSSTIMSPPAQDSNVVTVRAHVLDSSNRFVTNLDVNNFRVFEDKLPQGILGFSEKKQDVPASVGIVVDESSAAKENWPATVAALKEFLKLADPATEFFLVDSANRAQLTVPFTNEVGEVGAVLAGSKPAGVPVLLDSIYLAIEEMKRAKHTDKAILVLNSSWNDHSRHNVREILSALREKDVQLYFVTAYDQAQSFYYPAGSADLRESLKTLADQSGGSTFELDEKALREGGATDVVVRIGLMLRSFYEITYSPTHSTQHADYHRIEIKLVPPPGVRDLKPTYRHSYQASAQ